MKLYQFANIDHRLTKVCLVKVKLRSSEGQPNIILVECHPLYNQTGLLEYSKKNQILLTAYSPLGSVNKIFDETKTSSLNLIKVSTTKKRTSLPLKMF